jgi:MoxR-like ATPase
MAMVMNNQLEANPRYEGFDDLNRQDKKPLYQPKITGSYDPLSGRAYYPYFPTYELQEAVNLAITLERPLLIEGEPGCGKTRLAESIAYEFSCKYLNNNTEPEKDWWFFREWNVKSVGRAQDGLYTFDAVGRLRDAQLVGAGIEKIQEWLGDAPENKKELINLKSRLTNKSGYLKFGPLGDALKQAECLRPIVLIDEIDKADSDFPNDLLRELDRLQFTVAETETTYPEKLKIKPIVIITSNRERPLPEPFLRRCLYFKLGFPDDDQLQRIILGRFPKIKKELMKMVMEHFRAVRDLFADEPGSKPPGTSEILDFITVLQNKSIKEIREDLAKLPERSRSHLLGIVLKTERDQRLYRENFGAEENE